MTPVTSDLDRAAWIQPGTSFTITYPLPLLHEIDFLVNEGYRSIPYGGVEIGGLLFGHSDQTSTRIEAFRSIQCEHAFGPSFVLSERDVSLLKQQLDSAGRDPDIQGLETIGWFISHTRKDLQTNDHESSLFDQLFPKPGAITLLVKPERFKPTRFGFLVRNPHGEIQRDAAQHAVILPLHGRASQATEAPPPSTIPPEEKRANQLERIVAEPAEPAPETPIVRAVPAPPPEPPRQELAERVLPPAVEKPPEPKIEAKPPTSKIEPHDLPDSLPKETTALIPVPRKRASSSSEEAAGRGPEGSRVSQSFDARVAHEHITRKIREEGVRSNTRLIIILLVAAALGCAVGYWAYLQLPSATIPLTIRSQPPTLIVSWPPQQTRDAVYVSIRIDDSEPRPLSADDKESGETHINAPGDNVKVELIAQHWMRDSRGIVRFIRALKPPPPPALPEAEKPPGSESHHRSRRR